MTERVAPTTPPSLAQDGHGSKPGALSGEQIRREVTAASVRKEPGRKANPEPARKKAFSQFAEMNSATHKSADTETSRAKITERRTDSKQQSGDNERVRGGRRRNGDGPTGTFNRRYNAAFAGFTYLRMAANDAAVGFSYASRTFKTEQSVYRHYLRMAIADGSIDPKKVDRFRSTTVTGLLYEAEVLKPEDVIWNTEQYDRQQQVDTWSTSYQYTVQG